MTLIDSLKRPLGSRLVAILLFLGFLIYYINAALSFPNLFNVDAHLNHAATRYIGEHHKLPVIHEAENKQIVFSADGATRLLRPPFTYILSAATAGVSEGWVESELRGQRLGSAVLGTITVLTIFIGFHIAFQHMGLAVVGAVGIGLLPKFVFLSSSNNDDIGAIFSVSLLFASVLALRRYGSNAKVLVCLAFAAGLVLQTKYTAWLVLPWFAVYCAACLKQEFSTSRRLRELIRLSPVMIVVFIAAGGWWLIFNMINYGFTDPSALRHAAELQREITGYAANQSGYASQGIGIIDLLLNHDGFLSKSYKSFVGYLEWIKLEVGAAIYLVYGLVITAGITFSLVQVLLNRNRQEGLVLIILCAIFSQVLFYLHHNWARDVQPQARYVLPVVMPLFYLFLALLKSVPDCVVKLTLLNRDFGFKALSTSGLTLSFLTLHTVSFAYYVKPSYEQRGYQTLITRPQIFSASHFLKNNTEKSSENVAESVTIERKSGLPAERMLSDDFCQALPLNALVTFDVLSPAAGGMHLRLKTNPSSGYDKVIWQPVIAGDSQVTFTANADLCSQAKISLAKGTHKLKIKRIVIKELRINKHSPPI